MNPLTLDEVKQLLNEVKEHKKEFKVYCAVVHSNGCSLLNRVITDTSFFDEATKVLWYFDAESRGRRYISLGSPNPHLFLSYWHAYGYKLRWEMQHSD